MNNYFNDAGEPLMDGASMRYEMYLDSMDEPEFDPYDDLDPEECDGDPEFCPDGGCPGCDEREHAEHFGWLPEDAAMESALFGDC